jgi:subtilisin family serine protease
MRNKKTRHLTSLALPAIFLMLALPASAQLAIDGIDDPDRLQLVNDFAGAAGEELAESPNGIYIIRMIDDPVVAYEGGIRGLRATKPRKGSKINPNSRHVIEYVGHLNGKHAEALSKIGGGQKTYDYSYSFNGFAARLSHQQAKNLQSTDGVVAVWADEPQILDTATTTDFLGLTAPGGLWDMGVQGEDVIIGIIDGGVWPESLSFSDRTGTNGNSKKDGKLDYRQIPGWHGKCTPGEQFNASHCNQKLIGARYYNAGFGGNEGIDATLPWEFNSPRDFGGHGSHTASTSGGNANTPLTGDQALFGTANGIAPRARIASYKTCWQTPTGGSCFSSDSIAAIDQAVADGVDVLNYSISGSRTNFLDGVEVAFAFAADAGVFVAASAGNSGSTSTVAHPGPWLTTVAASTHDRNYDAELTLGDGSSYTGASTNTTGVAADLVYSADVVLAGADPDEGRLCYPGTLDSALVAGKIVLCDRGTIARVDKSLAVFIAGGVGSILANPDPGMSLNADFHSVPTVHVDNVAGDAIRAYATGGGTPTAEIAPSYFSPVPAPAIAGFSSRGPLLAGDGDLLKPDVAAPGVDVLAAVAPPGNSGQDFASYSGTSMASPHVAGLAALLTEMHPDWSPMMIKSAMMTTGYDLISGADPFAQGAGHVDPLKVGDPGLVYDHGFNDWLDFVFGGGTARTDLNGASIAIGSLLGSQTVSRTVTSVGDSTETYTFTSSVPGIDVVATPSSFTIEPGATQTFDLEITANGAALNSYNSGFAYWTGDMGHVVRSPIVVRPLKVRVDAEVDGGADAAGDGSVDVGLSFGYDGAYFASVSGMEPGISVSGTVVAPFDLYLVDLPVSNVHFRMATFDEDTTTPGADDLDIRLFYGPAGCGSISAQLGGSGGATSAEVIDVSNGPAGCYWLVVDYFAAAVGDSIDYTLWVNAVFGDNGNTSITAPAMGTKGGSETVTVEYSGLAPTRNLGILHHEDGGGEIARTILDIDARQ